MAQQTNTLRRRRHVRDGVIALSSAATVALLAGLDGTFAASNDASNDAGTLVPEQTPPVERSLSRGYADLVERVSPAVVSVSVTRNLDMAGGPGGGADNPFEGFEEFERFMPEGDLFERFRRFFEERGGPGGPGGPGGEGGPESPFGGPGFATNAGSGFIVDPDGYVVTNNHVVAEADEIEVVMQDGRRVDAELVGRDPKTDLALLKVDAGEPLPYVEWGDSDQMRVGDHVVAVGNPFGLGGTVTAGIVSARSRDLGGPYDDYLQIDAPINRGNSGGPTFNLDGEVVGVNSAIYSPTGGSVGIGFAISSDLAQQVIAELREDGTIERGYLGVTIQQVDEDLAAGLGLDEPKGALITRIMPDGPAAGAGFERGDVILSFNGTEIEELRDLTRAVAETDPGEQGEAVVWRDGERTTVGVAVGTMPTDEQMAALAEPGEAEDPAAEEMPQLGMSLAAIDDQARAEFGLAEDVEGGVVVTRVEPGSTAAREGIRPGDVVIEAGRKQVSAPEDVATAAREAADEGKESVLLLVRRDGGDRFVAVELEDEATAG